MNTTTPINESTGVMAAIHRAGDVWRAVVGRVAGGRLRILDSREFRSDKTSMAPWLKGLGVERVIGVLPGGSVICRTCQLPNASTEQLLPALQLQAEAYLLGTAAPHRSAMAVLHAAPGETSRSGIILAWPESATTDVAALPTEFGAEVTFAPDVAALAALLNGSRPSEPLMWVDRSTGSVSMAITHANGAIFRATREDARSAESWKQGVSRAVAETALSVGHSAPFIESLIKGLQDNISSVEPGQGLLIVPEELSRQFADRVDAGTRPPAWWSDYGVAVGALLATTDQLEPLTRLRLAPVVETPNEIERWASRLSDRRLAYKVAAVCLALALISPAVFSAMRYGLLRLRHGDVRDERTAVRDIESKLSLYENLAARWSMTKLLADIACNTPEGVEVESLSMSTTRGVRMTGTAKADADRSALDVLNTMQKQLQDSTVFDRVDYSYEPEEYGNYSFTLTADVRDPHFQVEYPLEMDFAKRTMRERKYPETADENDVEVAAVSDDDPAATAEDDGGDEVADDVKVASSKGTSENGGVAIETGEAALTDEATDEPADASEGSTRVASRGGSTAEGVERRSVSRGGPGVAPSMDIPEPLSDDRINAMTVDEVMAAMAVVGKARKGKVGTDEDKARLEAEWNKLKARLTELRSK